MRLFEKEILIIPKAQGNIKKFRLSRSIQVVFLILFCLLGITTGYISYDYISLKRQMSDYIRIIEENQVLVGESEKISQNLLKAVERFEKLKFFAEEVSALIGISEDDKVSKGGPDLYTMYSDFNKTERLNELRENIVMNLTREISEKEENFIRIKDFIYKNNSLIAATPAIWPVRGYITSGFSTRINPITGKREFHQAIDIAGPIGTPILSTADGIVTRSEHNQFGYGKLIEIKHGFGFSTRYAHLNSLNVKVGQIVTRGQIIGTRGNTGRSSGPHLHYEVRINNKPVNPINFILDFNLE